MKLLVRNNAITGVRRQKKTPITGVRTSYDQKTAITWGTKNNTYYIKGAIQFFSLSFLLKKVPISSMARAWSTPEIAFKCARAPTPAKLLLRPPAAKTRSRGLGGEWLKIVEFPFWESEFYPEVVNRKVQKNCWQVTSSVIESKSFIIDMIVDCWLFWLFYILFFPQQVSTQ